MALPPKRQCIGPTTSIPVLNDDVSLEIFSFLDIHDLNTIASVCTDFKRMAKEVFGTRYKSKVFSIQIGMNQDERGEQEVKALFRQIKSVLRNFGSLICSLKIVFYIYRNRMGYLPPGSLLLDWITVYCGESLRKLELSGFQCGPTSSRDWSPFYRDSMS